MAGIAPRRTPSYSSVTELPSSRATSEQCAILYSRYHVASRECSDKDVLEVGCGSGIGLGYLARTARRVVGGDIDGANCRIARSTYRGNPKIEVRWLDAQQLPFEDRTFDVVVLFEAIYYLDDAEAFFREASRVLRPGGKLIVSTVNREWGGFNPSPLSTQYFTAAELVERMNSYGFQTRVLASFPERVDGIRYSVAKFVRRVAIQLRLIPRTMKGKEWLKRLFYGRLRPLPCELPEGFSPLCPITELSNPYETKQYRIVYAIGERP
ncbi:MAG: class I SAM-dependent methyltransferase [Acidobacteria bacterium]|nr:class I SAM-dependent methyltransferase [Acidobacteriota bacterium]